MAPKAEKAPDQNPEQGNEVTINRLSSAVKMPYSGRDSTLFLGWTNGKTPIASWNSSLLSEQARESFRITKTIKFPLNAEFAQYDIKPVQFLTYFPSIDLKDQSNDYTQDILVLGAAGSTGETEYIRVPELDLLASIIKGYVVWEDVNDGTITATDKVVQTQSMFTLFLPVRDADDNKVLYVLLFEPPMSNESNESTFKYFLMQTIQAFFALDDLQADADKKGYRKAFEAKKLPAQSNESADAYVVLKMLHETGLFENITNDRLRRVWEESKGRSFEDNMKILGREFGFFNLKRPSNQSRTNMQEFDKIDIDNFIKLFKSAFDKVSDRFRNGK